MIQIKNLSKSYNKKNSVVKDINLEIKNGEIFGFLGPNGAGKTTTIKMMTGILNIEQGDILIDNNSIIKQPTLAKKSFGYVPDNCDMFLKLKGIEYLNFMADIYDISENDRKERIEELTEILDMQNVLNNRIETYSHGMRQKIVIIGSLISNPNNWIIDEPMVGLDPKSVFEIKRLMKSFSDNNKTVFFSTHILDIAEKVCDRIGIINKGEIVFVGTIDEMRKEFKENKSLEEIFVEITKK